MIPAVAGMTEMIDRGNVHAIESCQATWKETVNRRVKDQACIYIVATYPMLRYRIDIEDTLEAEMRVIVKKWGNSASVRIPAAVMQSARLHLDEAVDIREEGGRIVIEPVRPREYDLDQLLAGITSENQHTEADFGAPVGKEAL